MDNWKQELIELELGSDDGMVREKSVFTGADLKTTCILSRNNSS